MPWPKFPACPGYGFTVIPDYDDTVVERANGRRTVNVNWQYPLMLFSAVPMGEKAEDDMHRVLRFWHAGAGRANRFLFKDYTDFKSSVVFSDAITFNDQQVILNPDDSPASWQLYKRYRDDDNLLSQLRIIQKPVQGTIRIADEGVELDEGPDWTLDYDTGIVTFAVEPESPTWGGEFWVPCMFETKPAFVITNKRIQASEFSLRELRLDDEDL